MIHRIRTKPLTHLKVVFLTIAVTAIMNGAFAQEEPSPRPIALVGGMLLDGYDAPPVHHAVVIIEGDKIVAAGPGDEVRIPENAHIIDTRGKTMMPGLIDLHMHSELIGHGDYAEYFDYLDGTARFGEMRAIAAKQLLRAGVTTAVDLGSTMGILDTKKAIEAGEIPGPRIIASGPWITRVSVPINPPGFEIVVDSPREAAQRTIEQIDAGVDVIKAWVGLTEEDMRAMVEAAHERGIQVHAHLYDPARIWDAINAGVDVLQHVGSAKNPPYDDELISYIAHKSIPIVQTIAHRIWVYPATLAFPERLEDERLREDLPPALYEEFQRSFVQFHRKAYYREVEREIHHSKIAARQFIDAGAVMGVGTDGGSPMNFHTESMWREMSALVDSGMTPSQVISAATKTNAEILNGRGNMFGIGEARNFGTVEPGMIADVIVIDGNPLFDINALANVELVIRAGVPWYSEQNRSRVLAEIGEQF
jgi:imidazolonepropionase-like amidohydrolase